MLAVMIMKHYSYKISLLLVMKSPKIMIASSSVIAKINSLLLVMIALIIMAVGSWKYLSLPDKGQGGLTTTVRKSKVTEPGD